MRHVCGQVKDLLGLMHAAKGLWGFAVLMFCTRNMWAQILAGGVL